MLIGELSKLSGFSRDTIRYYEKLGLISFKDKRTHLSSHKDYPEEVLQRLIAIRRIKEYGFTLEEMKSLFILFEEGVLEQQRGKRYLARKIEKIDKKIEELTEIRNRISQIVSDNSGACAIHDILSSMNNHSGTLN